MGAIYIGISGWRYAPWRGVFYPPGLAQARELDYASRFLPTIEINGSFYALQRPASYAAWHDATPRGFVFAVKGNRFLTHMLKLRGIETPLANVLASGVFALRDKLGPILWQLPPQLRFDAGKVEHFLGLLPHDTGRALDIARGHDDKVAARALLEIDAVRPLRHAVEVRHESFRDPAFIALLRKYGVAVVVADTAGKWPDFDEVTADFVYVRLHGEHELYASGYDDASLARWAARIRAWAKKGDVYCYFDNDIKVRAPFDAKRLMEMVGVDWKPAT
ncbi:DUF72 domain-containing protein [Massilia sp. Root335]|uniref:DUF72 domain-containing protein n=1 Tax=Massilia sp. Root335 TaxID=1736517 RepID=UPI0006F35966|nr:DUF72 domain-containing protein [Massilia sp. Root335]KQV50945.1 hypothetical protein ASC93_09715 [Massilia sp. Root335]